jgi:hypothetical protein
MQLSRSGISLLRDLDEVAMIYDHLCDGPSRRAVRHVTSSVVDWRGQVVSMTDRAYLTQLMPMCVVWGSDDRVIPAFHSTIVSSYAPGAQVHVLEERPSGRLRRHRHRLRRIHRPGDLPPWSLALPDAPRRRRHADVCRPER